MFRRAAEPKRRIKFSMEEGLTARGEWAKTGGGAVFYFTLEPRAA